MILKSFYEKFDEIGETIKILSIFGNNVVKIVLENSVFKKKLMIISLDLEKFEFII